MPLPSGRGFAPSKISIPFAPPRLGAPVAAPASAAPPTTRSARRDTQIDDDLINLKEQRRLYSQSVDLPSVAANTTSNTDVTTASQTCEQGDYIEFIGGEIDHGYIVVGCLPCPSNDTIRLRVANLTGGAINPTAATLYFVIHKFVSTQ